MKTKKKNSFVHLKKYITLNIKNKFVHFRKNKE